MRRVSPAVIFVWLAALLTLSLHAGTSFAQGGSTLVAIVAAEPNAPLTRRVRTELEGLGLEVVVIKPPAEASAARTPLERAARGVGAIAAVRIVASEGGVEVWVADRVTGKAVVREVVPPSPAGPASDAYVALGVVELLRASLMELHAGAPSRGDAPATDRVRALALPEKPRPAAVPRLALSASGGVELGLAGGSPSPYGLFALWVRTADRFGARGFMAMSLSPARFDVPEGAIEVSAIPFGLEVSYDFAAPDSTWVPTLGIGGAGARVTAAGTADTSFIGATESVFCGGPMLHAGLGFAFVRGLRLRADATSFWAGPTPRIRVLGANAGKWGAPFLLLSLGAEVLWSPG